MECATFIGQNACNPIVGVRVATSVGRRAGGGAVDVGLLGLRLFTGAALAFAHGINKLPPTDRFVAGIAEMGFPFPVFFAWASALAEFGGGLLLAAGLFTRPAAFCIVVNMAVATFIRQAGDPFTEREPAMLFGMIALLYLIAGPGQLSIDAMRVRRRVREPSP